MHAHHANFVIGHLVIGHFVIGQFVMGHFSWRVPIQGKIECENNS